jgi:tripartite-type tricarboxylate transporter receptor subunit TctC
MTPTQTTRRALSAALCAAILAGAAPLARAADPVFPSGPIRFVVPASGGTVDMIARVVAPKLQQALGQPVVVETKAGASGNIAAAFVAKAPPDGHTVLIGFNPLAISAVMSQGLAYELKDLAPITLAASSEQLLVVNAAVPVNTLAEFVALSKKPGSRLNYASIAPGSASHLTMELFKVRSGADVTHIPYKGAAPAISDLLGNQVQSGVFAAANVIGHVKTGRLKALAVTGNKRLQSLPQVPSMAEAGLPDFNATIWLGFLTASGTPKPVIRKLNEEIGRILTSPDVRKSVETAEFDVVASTPEEFDNFIRREVDTWRRVVVQTGAKLD